MRTGLSLLKIIGVSIAVIYLSVTGWEAYRFLTAPIATVPKSTEVTIDIPRGASLKAISEQLAQKGMMPHPKWFQLYLKVRGTGHKIRYGEFRISPQWTVAELVHHLETDAPIRYHYTLVPGLTFQEMWQQIRALPKLTHQADLSPAQLQQQWQLKSLEGQFLPETYAYEKWGDSDRALLQRIHQAMVTFLQQAWSQRAPHLPLKSPQQALILASIVEKETGKASERPLIAGVFVNRLKKGMRLQSDPTVIYGMGDAYQGNIRKKDLRTKTAYNTYRINGLPPTPICMPSKASIQAVLHPAKTQALYFVGKGDGSHQFSDTLKQHNRAVRHYQLGH